MQERFSALYNGLQRAYGKYLDPDKPAASGKLKGRGRTVQEPLTEVQWALHLKGEQRLGVIPIRDDGTCVFGAIDIDDYSLDHHTMAQRCQDFPLVLTRSKSGGLHLWLFFAEPVPARLLRNQLALISTALGYPTAEVFPKQDQLASNKDVGNWINLPYYDADHNTMVYGWAGTRVLSLPQWLDYAEDKRLSLRALEQLEIPEVADLEGAPPCIQTLARHGVPEGMRNNALFAFGVYARKRVITGWEDLTDELNRKFFVPPLKSSEVAQTVGSLKKKDYFYPCKQQPIATYCNRSQCLQCKFGVGELLEKDDPGIALEEIVKVDSDPPHYFVQVSGQRIEIPDASMLLSQRTFRRLVFEKVDILPTIIKETKWTTLINEVMKRAQHVDAPDDAGTYGLFEVHLQRFCTTRAQAIDREELLQGKPWTDNQGYTWFRSTDLFSYLERQRFRSYRPHQVWALLRTRSKGLHKVLNIKGTYIRAWAVPAYPMQDEPFEIPRIDTDPQRGTNNE